MAKNIIKNDLIKEVAKKSGISPKIVGIVIDHFINAIKKNVFDYRLVFFRGFGKFMLRKMKSKKAYDMWRKKHVMVPEHYIFDFKPNFLLEEKSKKMKIRDDLTGDISKQLKNLKKTEEKFGEDDDNYLDPDATSFAPKPPKKDI